MSIYNIEARKVWKPMHLQPLFKDAAYYSHEPGNDCSAYLFEHGICLPSGSNMSESEQQRVIDRVGEFVAIESGFEKHEH